MIPEEGNYEVLKAAIETCPALPSFWQPALMQRFREFMSDVRWFSLTEGSIDGRLIYVAYLDGCATHREQAKKRVAEEVRKFGGWLFDWNGECVFNFGIALPRLLDGYVSNSFKPYSAADLVCSGEDEA